MKETLGLQTLKFFLAGWKSSVFLLVSASAISLLFRFPPVLIFSLSTLSLVPLAALLGSATEELSAHIGPVAGGLANATLGNAPELILGLIFLWHGQVEVVKASLCGSIIGNLLLVFGASAFLGGFKWEKQTFNVLAAGTSASMLLLATVALVMPALFDLTVYGSLSPNGKMIESLSFWTAVILLVSYLGSLAFILRTHRSLFGQTALDSPRVSITAAVMVLIIVSTLIAVESEILAGQIEPATHSLGWTDRFVGLVILAIVANAAEQSTAVLMARKDKMDLSLSIAMGSSSQIALFVAPLLVIVSRGRAIHMTLVFHPLEIAAVVFSVAVVTLVSLDGETNWFEGLQLLSIYAILVVIFFLMPGT